MINCHVNIHGKKLFGTQMIRPRAFVSALHCYFISIKTKESGKMPQAKIQNRPIQSFKE